MPEIKRIETFVIPVLLFFLNFFVKFYFIGYRDIALDEPFSIFHAQGSLSQIWNYFTTAAENNPPGYFILLHWWIDLFGIEPSVVRFPSLLCSCVTAVLIYIIAKNNISFRAGVFAALLYTFSTMHVYFSHEARVYSLFTLLATLSLYCVLEISKSNKPILNFIVLFIANILLLYCHYFGLWVLFIEMCALFYIFKSKFFKQTALFFGLLILSYIPLFLSLKDRLVQSTTAGTWVTAPKASQLYGFLNLFINNRYVSLVVILVVAGLLFYSYKKQVSLKNILQSFKGNDFFMICVLWFIIPYVLMFLVSVWFAPMFIDRYILHLSVPFYLLVAFMLNKLSLSKMIEVGVYSLVLVAMLITVDFNPDNNRRIKEVAEYCKKSKTNNTLIVITPDYADLGFAYYYNRDWFTQYDSLKIKLKSDFVFGVNSKEEIMKMKPDSAKSHIILVEAGNEFVDPVRSVYNYISSEYSHVSTKDIFEIYKVHEFKSK